MSLSTAAVLDVLALIDAEAVHIATMAVPDMMGWLTMVEAGTLVDIARAAAMARVAL